MTITKPAYYTPWIAANTRLPAIAAKAVFLVPFWEGSGAPYDLISGVQAVPRYATPGWTTQDGMLCMDGGVGGHWQWDVPPLPAMDQPITYFAVSKGESFLRLPYKNVQFYSGSWGSGIDAAYGASQTYSGLWSEDAPPGAGWHAFVITLTSRAVPGAWATDGAPPPTTPAGTDDESNPSDIALSSDGIQLNLGIADNPDTLDAASFIGMVALFSPALTQEEAEQLTADPSGVVATRVWEKPAPWAYDPLLTRLPTLAAAAAFNLPCWEGTGVPVDLVTGDPITASLPTDWSWTESEGIPVLQTLGNGHFVLARAVISQHKQWTALAVVRVTSGAARVYHENQTTQNGTYVDAIQIAIPPGDTGIWSDTYNNDTSEEVYDAFAEDPVFPELRVVVLRRNGAVLSCFLDGEEQESFDQFITSDVDMPVLDQIWIGIGLIGELAGLTIWNTARSDGEIAQLSADPFGAVAPAEEESGSSRPGGYHHARRVAIGLFP